MAHLLGDGATRARSLSRVHWRLGQALLPEHFERQEAGFARALELRFAQLAPASWGVAEIGWNKASLARGLVHVAQLVAITPRGRVIDVPGNARVAPLDLAAAQEDRVAIYAHLQVEPSYEREDDRARDLEAIELVVERVELSTAAGHPDAADSFELARFAKGADGVWRLDDGYVPPLIALAAWPSFFESVLDRVRRVLASWEEILLGDLESYVLSIAKGLRAREGLRRSRLVSWYLNQIDAAAPARGNGPNHADSVLAAHPFELFRRLLELALDVHAYQSAPADVPALAGQVYDHRDIVGSFAPILVDLEARTRRPHGRAPYAPFVRNGRVVVCPLPGVVESIKLYWLVRRGAAQVDPLAVKLAGPARLEVVHRHALRGVGVRELASVPFRHDFDPDVTFFELIAEGDEWDLARREGKLAYVAEGPIAGCETYLFWRDV